MILFDYDDGRSDILQTAAGLNKLADELQVNADVGTALVLHNSPSAGREGADEGKQPTVLKVNATTANQVLYTDPPSS